VNQSKFEDDQESDGLPRAVFNHCLVFERPFSGVLGVRVGRWSTWRAPRAPV